MQGRRSCERRWIGAVDYITRVLVGRRHVLDTELPEEHAEGIDVDVLAKAARPVVKARLAKEGRESVDVRGDVIGRGSPMGSTAEPTSQVEPTINIVEASVGTSSMGVLISPDASTLR